MTPEIAEQLTSIQAMMYQLNAAQQRLINAINRYNEQPATSADNSRILSAHHADKKLLTASETMEYLGIGKTKFYNSVVETLVFVDIGGQRKYRIADIDAWIEKNCINGEIPRKEPQQTKPSSTRRRIA